MKRSTLRNLLAIGGALLVLLGLVDRLFVLRDLFLILQALSWWEWLFIAVGLVPTLLVVSWVLEAFCRKPKEPKKP